MKFICVGSFQNGVSFMSNIKALCISLQHHRAIWKLCCSAKIFWEHWFAPHLNDSWNRYPPTAPPKKKKVACMYSSTCFCMYLDLFILGMAGFVLWAHLYLYSGHVCICNTWRRVRRSYCRGNFGGFERIRRRQHSLYLCPRIFPREHLIIIKKKILKQDSLNPVDSFSQFCDISTLHHPRWLLFI